MAYPNEEEQERLDDVSQQVEPEPDPTADQQPDPGSEIMADQVDSQSQGDGTSSFLDDAADMENGDGERFVIEDGPSPDGTPVSANELMDAAEEDNSDVDQATADAMDDDSLNIVTDSFSNNTGDDSSDNASTLDLSDAPKEDDSLWNKMGSLFGNKKDDDKAMASVSEAVDDYKKQEQNVASKDAGLPKSMEYRGMPQGAAPARGGRGGHDMSGRK